MPQIMQMNWLNFNETDLNYTLSLIGSFVTLQSNIYCQPYHTVLINLILN